MIFALSAGGALQFALVYCRSVVEAYGRVPISARLRESVRPSVARYQRGEFGRLLGLLRYAPKGAGRNGLRAVRAYFGVLAAARWLATPIWKGIGGRIESELARCTYALAIALDRRLALAAVPSAAATH